MYSRLNRVVSGSKISMSAKAAFRRALVSGQQSAPKPPLSDCRIPRVTLIAKLNLQSPVLQRADLVNGGLVSSGMISAWIATKKISPYLIKLQLRFDENLLACHYAWKVDLANAILWLAIDILCLTFWS